MIIILAMLHCLIYDSFDEDLMLTSDIYADIFYRENINKQILTSLQIESAFKEFCYNINLLEFHKKALEHFNIFYQVPHNNN